MELLNKKNNEAFAIEPVALVKNNQFRFSAKSDRKCYRIWSFVEGQTKRAAMGKPTVL